MQIKRDHVKDLSGLEAARPREAVIVQASMSQVEMTVWLCVMAVLAFGMMAMLALAGK